MLTISVHIIIYIYYKNKRDNNDKCVFYFETF